MTDIRDPRVLWCLINDGDDIHIPDPLFLGRAVCGAEGEESVYGSGAYVLDEDWCVECADWQQAHRDLIAGLKDVVGDAVALSPDRVYNDVLLDDFMAVIDSEVDQ